MKIVRIEIPGDFIASIGANAIFSELDSLEILNAYQYDRDNFFSLQRFHFKSESKARTHLQQFLSEKFNAHYIQIIEEHENEVICLLKQNLATSFFKMLEPGPWAIIFPLNIIANVVFLNILAEEEILTRLYDLLGQFSQQFKVISTETVKDFYTKNAKIQDMPKPWPRFSPRQKEITAYAAMKGYFNSPKEISGEEIAAHFKLSITTINEHLRNAQNLAMKFFFGGN